MTEDTTNLVLERLRAIKATLDQHTKRFDDIELRLAAIESHMAGFQLSEVRHNSELDRVKQRRDRIERRLELADGE
jgi:predicted  nucleic acid-binding Zn-ribbon protein